MSDALSTALLPRSGLRVVAALTTEVSREARRLHRAEAGSAALLSEALTAVSLLAALRKERTRVSLQLECDGPVRGVLVDAEGGSLRGDAKKPGLAVPSGAEALGAAGGVLLQKLPGGDAGALAEAGGRLLPEVLDRALLEAGGSGPALLRALSGAEMDVLAKRPLEFRCDCSRERVHRALLALGRPSSRTSWPPNVKQRPRATSAPPGTSSRPTSCGR